MPVTAALRTGITRWSSEADPYNRTQTDADHALLDDLVGIDLHDGALAARPAVGIRGRYFTESTASAGLPGTTWREDGVAWRAIGARVLSQSSTDVAQVVAGVTGQTADLQQWRAGASTLGRVDNTGQMFAVGAQLGPSPQTALAAMLGVTPSTAAAIAAIIRGAVSQSGDLQQWQTSAGTAVAKVDSAGAGTFAGLTTAGTMTGRLARWSSAAASDVPVQVTGFAGQTGNLTEWRTSTPTVVASVDPTGLGTFAGLTTAGTMTGRLARWTSGAVGDVVAQLTGFAGQTGNLTEWRSSTPTVLASVAADGSGTFANLTTAGTVTGRFARWTATAIGDVPAIVKGVVGQTGNLQQWQSNTGTVLANVDAFGDFSTVGRLQAYHLTPAGTYSAALVAQPLAIGERGIVVQGLASQSGSLQEWQDSAGSLLAKVAPAGWFYASAGVYGGSGASGSAARNALWSTTTTDVAAEVRSAVGNTADIQRWMIGTNVYARVDRFGQYVFSGGSGDGTGAELGSRLFLPKVGGPGSVTTGGTLYVDSGDSSLRWISPLGNNRQIAVA